MGLDLNRNGIQIMEGKDHNKNFGHLENIFTVFYVF